MHLRLMIVIFVKTYHQQKHLTKKYFTLQAKLSQCSTLCKLLFISNLQANFMGVKVFYLV